MNENNEIFTEAVTGSVSDNQVSSDPSDSTDALPDIPTDPVVGVPEEPLEETGNGTDEFPWKNSVSGSDILLFSYGSAEDTVSAGDIYNITYETVEEVPIWEKPISDYTVTEGLLLLIFILLQLSFLFRILKFD